MEFVEYNSDERSGEMRIASLYGKAFSSTEIGFPKEGFSATVEPSGHVELFDAEKLLVAAVDALGAQPPSDCRDSELYEEVRCVVENGKIVFRFPRYEWEDDYPYCDGEYDRWSKFIRGWSHVSFDCESRQLVVGRV